MKHPTTELIAYLTGGLSPEERAGLETHLAACADCRRERDGFTAVLADLRGSLPTVPEPRWGQWRAELRGRLQARHGRWRWLRPFPLAVSAALAAAVLIVVLIGNEQRASRPELAAMEEVAIGGRLELVREYPVLERLDLLENLELIDDLDRLVARSDG
jgi:anti-sigma factor RsiW